MLLVRCEPVRTPHDSVVTSLLVRGEYFGASLEEALRCGEPIKVVAFWRRLGLPWSARTTIAAERFGVGVGGSMTATLVPLGP